MSRAALKREVIAANRRLVNERAGWRSRIFSLRARIARHRETWIVAGGFAGGVVAGLLPLRGIAQAARVTAGVASFVLRNPLGALFVEGLRRSDDTAEGNALPALGRPQGE